jgi:hypothetical protein
MLARAQAGGGGVDVYNLDVTWTAEFAAAGYLQSLDESRVRTGDFLPAPAVHVPLRRPAVGAAVQHRRRPAVLQHRAARKVKRTEPPSDGEGSSTTPW